MLSFFDQNQGLIVFELFYVLVLIAVCFRIIIDTRSVSKTMAYLLLVIFVPVIGIIFYFSFGINYRKRKIYNLKLEIDGKLKKELETVVENYNKNLHRIENSVIYNHLKLIKLVENPKVGSALVLPNQEVEILQNGEELYPKMLDELRNAKSHIHIEYYIYENDTIGNQIKDILIQKVKEGIEVRFIYDDFGCRGIRKNIVQELQEAGVQAYPFHKIYFILLANRLNYRNHRKIVVIDGYTSFVGGINVSDRYINPSPTGLYWRDTHLMIKGYSSLSLQRVFLSDWNFCSGENILMEDKYFPLPAIKLNENTVYTQIVSSGPDSDLPSILYALIKAINSAKSEILLTTPYFVPDTSLLEALEIAALSGVDVKLLVPKTADSRLVNIASQSFFDVLIRAGVKVYLYEKGFIHAKTFVIDSKLASVGTANLDMRSFDLNFEVSALVYDQKIAQQLRDSFYQDLEFSSEIDSERWKKRSNIKRLLEKIVRLISPFM